MLGMRCGHKVDANRGFLGVAAWGQSHRGAGMLLDASSAAVDCKEGEQHKAREKGTDPQVV